MQQPYVYFLCLLIQKYFICRNRLTKLYRKGTIYLRSQFATSIGASIKDAGKICFGISRLEDVGIISDVLQRLEIETEEANN